VCLSGGGFRATLFGLGVLRYLAEVGQLKNVVAVSAVSGGSVAAAILADRWPDLARDALGGDAFQQHVADPFCAAISEHNLRNRGLARWTATRVVPRTHRAPGAMGATIAAHLLRSKRVADLPVGVQVILTATDLVSGRAFRISREFIGSWDFGYAATPPTLTLATAIAASTAVPFLFPPVHLATDNLGLRPNTPHKLALVDGGVYDNLGLEWFQGWDRGRPDAARAADFIITVDASSPLRPKPKRYGWVTSLKRSQEAQYAQTRASRVRWFVDQLLAGNLRGIHVPIDRDPRTFLPPPGLAALAGAAEAALPSELVPLISGLRTDLDRFLPEESQLIMYHGYWATHVRLTHLHPALATATPSWRDYADLSAAHTHRVLHLLQSGRERQLNRRR